MEPQPEGPEFDSYDTATEPPPPGPELSGARQLISCLLQCEVEVMFANPGTTEMVVVEALDHEPDMRAVLGMHETVCTGAADGYARMAGRPAATLLHLGVGLANGVANLHNARRAQSPILNIVGDMALWHRSADPLLAMDIEGLAKTVSIAVRTPRCPSRVAEETFACVRAMREFHAGAPPLPCTTGGEGGGGSRVTPMVTPPQRRPRTQAGPGWSQ